MSWLRACLAERSTSWLVARLADRSTRWGVPIVAGLAVATWLCFHPERAWYLCHAAIAALMFVISDERGGQARALFARLLPAIISPAGSAGQAKDRSMDISALLPEAEALFGPAAKAAITAAEDAFIANLPAPYGTIFAALTAMESGAANKIDAGKTISTAVTAEIAKALATPAPG